MLGHRIYDPGYARFLNRDPIGYVGGINTYSYAGNNPATYVDPDGLQYIMVLRADYYHSWIAIYNMNGSLRETWGLWQEGRKRNWERNRPGKESIAFIVPDYQVPSEDDWELTYNCADFAEEFWELNGGATVYPGSFIRTPWGMTAEIRRANRQHPTGVTVPAALEPLEADQPSSSSSSSSFNSSSSLSSGSGSGSSGSASSSSWFHWF